MVEDLPAIESRWRAGRTFTQRPDCYLLSQQAAAAGLERRQDQGHRGFTGKRCITHTGCSTLN
jgi:hypothetical protein